MAKKLKLLTWSDGPTSNTGFGRASREILKALYNTGKYDITSISINYFGLTPELPPHPTQSDKDISDAYHNYYLIHEELCGAILS